MDEIWKSIPGYEGLYEVSNLGKIRSLKRKTTNGKVLKTSICSSGYLMISLCKNGEKKTKNVHRLVAEVFLNSRDGLDVNHINGNKLDNNLSNLEIVTRKQNIQHSFDIGLQINDRGEKDSQAKRYLITFPDNTTKIIIGLAEFCRSEKIERRRMNDIMNNKIKNYRGYVCERI